LTRTFLGIPQQNLIFEGSDKTIVVLQPFQRSQI
jgi:hypothetical protein